MKKKLAVVLAALVVLATVDISVPVVRAAAYETVGETTEIAEGTLEAAEKALGEVADAAEQTVEKTAEGTGETAGESGVEAGQTVSEGNAEPVLLTGEMQTAAQAGQTYDVSALEFGNEGSEDVFTINASNKAQFENAVLTGEIQGRQSIRIDGVEIALTIQDLTIDLSEHYLPTGAITLCKGATLHLTLAGENLLKGGMSGAGICVNEGTVLEITAESNGKLTAVGGNFEGGAAGIGTNATGINLGGGTTIGGTVRKLGTIRILGGEIEASGGTYTYMGGVVSAAAGIGGSERGCTGEIEIGGGTVTANGGRGAAGIGGGTNGSVAKITISSGTVIANGGYIKVSNSKYAGASIGSGLGTGSSGKTGCADITISGGTVTANGNIGYGNLYSGLGFEGGSLTVSGGSVSLADGYWIVVETDNVNEDYMMHHYTLTFLLYDSLFEAEDSVTADVTLEADGRNYTKEMTLQTGSGKAVGELQADTLLHGKVSYTLQTASDSYSGTVDLDTEQQVIWGQEKNGLVITEQSGVTYRYANGVLTFSGIGSATVTMTEGVSTTADSIQITDGSNVTLTLCSVIIDSTSSNRAAITVGTPSGAECKLILEGENRLTANISKGAVVLVNGSSSTLEIGGRGSVQIRNGAGGQRGEWGYSAGIRVRDGALIFEDNPTVEVNTAQLSTAILSKNISIRGGKITGIAGSYGNGIGSQAEIAGYPVGEVKIEGGVVYGEGGYLHLEAGGLSNYYTWAIITGGNVKMNNLSGYERIQPENASHTKLWCTTIQVGNDNTLSRNAKIYSLTIKNSDGTTYAYGIMNTATDGDGKLYLWLPEDSTVSEVKTVNGTYQGSCKTTADYTSGYLGNTWGTAEATFSLEGDFFMPVTSVTCDLTAECTVGEYPLTATVTPTEATNQTITWSVTNSDGTAASGAKVEDGKLKITAAGTYQLTATIPCGLEKTPGTDSDYTRSFTIRARYATELKGLTMSGWTYGEDTTGREPAYTISPAGNTATAMIEYKKAGADDSTYTAALPVDAGNYTVRVTMPQTETYTGVEATADFTIAPKSLEAADITAVASDKQYTGQAVTLAAGELTLTDRDTALTVGKDYVIDGYRNNTAGGTAEVIVRGTGNYTGTRSVSFHIVGTADSGNTSSGSTSSESGTSSDNSSSDSDSSDAKSSDTGTVTASPTPAPTAAPKTTPAVRPTTRPAAQVPVESQAEENKNTDNTENTGITAPATGQATEDTGTADETQTENITATEQQESLTAQTSAEGQTSGGAARILVTVAAAALVVLGGGGTLLALRGKKSGK